MKPNWLFALFFALTFAGGSGLAATPPESAAESAPDGDSRREDPPARVGRISLIEGNVSFYSGDDWQRAVLNFPVTSSNAISAADGARAEIRIGSMALRIEENTELNLTVIDDRTIQLGLPKGSLSVSLRSIQSGEAYQIVTADTTIDLMRPGRFRIDADSDSNSDSNSNTSGGATRVTVFHGLATATAGAEIITVRGDESALLAGGKPEFGQADLDDFDRWVLARDREYEEARTAEAPSTLSPETTGYEELDRYGEWREHTRYGSLWYPNDVPAGWAPYRNGYWSHVAPWGWSWIDYAPWGFAPFHYGRWVYHQDRWGWWPGHYAHYPVYAPALVAYIGQPHSSVSISFGSYPLIGWFPLAPYEAYYPGFGYSSFYLSRLNRSYVRHPVREHKPDFNPGIDFANRKFHQAVTVVPRRAFVNERPVAPSTIPVVASPPPALVAGTIAPIAPLAPPIARNTTGSPTPSVPSSAIGSNIFGRTTIPQAGLANQRLSPVTSGVTAGNTSTPPRPGAPAIVRTIPGNNNGVAANRIPGAPIGTPSAGEAGPAGPAGRVQPGIPRGTNAIGGIGGGVRAPAPAVGQSLQSVRPPVSLVNPSMPSAAVPPRAIPPGAASVNVPPSVRSNANPVYPRAAQPPMMPRGAPSLRSGSSGSQSITPSIAGPAIRSAPAMRAVPSVPQSAVNIAPAITGSRQTIAPARAVAPGAAPQSAAPGAAPQVQAPAAGVRSGPAAAIRDAGGPVGGGSMGRSGGSVPGGMRGFGAR